MRRHIAYPHCYRPSWSHLRHDAIAVARALATAPGTLVRSLSRLLRQNRGAKATRDRAMTLTLA